MPFVCSRRGGCLIAHPNSRGRIEPNFLKTFDLITGLGPRQREYVVNGEESWIDWDNHCRRKRSQDRDDTRPNSKVIESSKRVLILAYFPGHGLVSAGFLPEEENYNSQFFTQAFLPSIERKLAECRRKLLTTTHLHIDNAKPHIQNSPSTDRRVGRHPDVPASLFTRLSRRVTSSCSISSMGNYKADSSRGNIK
jgi:hypothetical protein